MSLDIDGLVIELFEALGDIDDDAAMVPALLAQAERLRVLAAACEQTRMFTRAAEQFAEFKACLEADHAPDERLLAAWVHFLERASDAPTNLHRMGAVRVCLPLVARYLPEVEHVLWHCLPCRLEMGADIPCDACGQPNQSGPLPARVEVSL